MVRYRRNFRRFFSKPKRNSYRVIRANSASVAGITQVVAYTFTATEACTIKSIKLDTGVGTNGAETVPIVVPYVLVRVPEGYDAATINFPATNFDLYNPTQEVMISGVLTDATVEDHKFNSIGRKMKPGDRMALIYYNGTAAAINISYEINFSVLT